MKFFRRSRYATIKIKKKDLPAGLWQKCPSCNEIVYKEEIETGCGVCPKCSFHFKMAWKERLAMLTDEGSFEEWDADIVSGDPLGFEGYPEKITGYQKKTSLRDAVVTGAASMGRFRVGLGIMEFGFFGGSMGSVVGEKITRLIERSTENKHPVIIVSATGGARMQEGMFSLMQMAKTSAALARHADAGLLYISVLSHPSTAGVMASYASLGDIIICEPGALVGFAGPRVIRETTREDIPEGFQSSEFVLKHGLVDMIVNRRELKSVLVRLLGYTKK